jgi:GAF domain-containing protein
MSEDKLRYSLDELFSDFTPPAPEGETLPLPSEEPLPEPETIPPLPAEEELLPELETKPLPSRSGVESYETMPPLPVEEPLPEPEIVKPSAPAEEPLLEPGGETLVLSPSLVEEPPPEPAIVLPSPPAESPLPELRIETKPLPPPAEEPLPEPAIVPPRPAEPPAEEPLPAPEAVMPAPPETPALEDLQTWRQQLVRQMLRVILIVGSLAVVVGSYNAYTLGRVELIPIYVGIYAILILVTFWRNASYDIQVGVILSLLYGLGVLELSTAGQSGNGRLFLLALPLVAVLFLGRRSGIIALILSVLTLAVFTWAFSTGLIVVSAPQPTSLMDWLRIGVVFFIVGVLLVVLQIYLVPRLADSLTRNHQLLQEVEAHKTMLEGQTRTLQKVNYTLRRRVAQLGASADVGRAISSILDVAPLLRKAVALLHDRFGFYHAGIFLIDESGEWAVLNEATGEAGAQMVTMGHRLRVGESSLVGRTALHRRPHIALDVGEDAVSFDNPLLPYTHSEVALPIAVGERLLGVLDLQSTEEAAFEEEDARVLQSVADQIAVAIENARQVSKEVAILEVTSPIYRVSRRLTTATTTHEVADAIVDSVAETGVDGCLVVEFEYSPTGEPEALLYLSVWRKERLPQFQSGARLPIVESPFPFELVSSFWTVTDVEQDGRLPQSARRVFEATYVRSLVNIPLRVGERVIGQVVVLREVPGPFSDAALRVYEVLSDQAAVALERTRLLEEAQRRAEWEQLTRQIVDHTRRATDIERALQTTAEELSEALEVPHVSIELDVGALTHE